MKCQDHPINSVDHDSDICLDLLYTLYRLDLFEDTLTNRVVRSWQSHRLAILLRHGSEAATYFWEEGL